LQSRKYFSLVRVSEGIVMKKAGIFAVVAISIVLVVSVAAAIFISSSSHRVSQTIETGMTTSTVEIHGQTIRVSIADTPALRERGLGGRAALSPDEGMLFVFPQDGTYAFWMKDMRFSIDILWIAHDGTIVHIAPSVSPDTYPHSFAPQELARFVLELPAGYAQAHTIQRGDTVKM